MDAVSEKRKTGFRKWEEVTGRGSELRGSKDSCGGPMSMGRRAPRGGEGTGGPFPQLRMATSPGLSLAGLPPRHT